MSKSVGIAIAVMLGMASATALAQNGGYKAEYCEQVMTEQEMKALQEQLAEAQSDEEKTRILWENMDKAIQRAQELPKGTGGEACEFGK